MTQSWSESTLARSLLLALVIIGLFVRLGKVPLFDEDEGAYSAVTCEMLATHDLTTPRLYGRVFFQKPPLIYWAQAASVKAFGKNEFALRFPSALASFFWLLAVYFFACRFFDPSTAWYAVLFMLTALQTGIIEKAAIPDALLNLFITLAMFAIILHHRDPKRWYRWAAFVCMGLGFLAKGPIALLFPVVVSAIFYFGSRQWRNWLKAVGDPVGWVLFLLVTVPWFAIMAHRYGERFFDVIFLIHNVARFNHAFEGHSGPIFFYVPVVILGLIPHTGTLFKAMGRFKEIMRDPVNRFLGIWFAFVFIFFSLAGTKLHHYVVYGYVPLFLFMGQSAEKIRRPLLQVLWAVGFALIIGVLPLAALRIAPLIHDKFARLVISGAVTRFGPWHLWIMLAVAAAFLVLGTVRTIKPHWRTFVLGALFMAVVNFYLIPIVGDVMQAPVKEAALLAKARGYNVVMWQCDYPSFDVYLGHPVLQRKPVPGDVVITKATKLVGVKRQKILFEKHGVVLTRILEF